MSYSLRCYGQRMFVKRLAENEVKGLLVPDKFKKTWMIGKVLHAGPECHVTNEGDIIALDAKINFDDNGLFRHPDIAALRDEDEEDPLETRASRADLNYVRKKSVFYDFSILLKSIKFIFKI